MGPCQSIKSTRPNKKKQSKPLAEKIERKIEINEYNTNNTKNLNININNSCDDISDNQTDLKLRSTMIPNDNMKDSNTVDDSINKNMKNEIDSKIKKINFLPHLYNSFSNEDLEFYKTLIQIQQNYNFFPKSVYSLDDLKLQLTLQNKNSPNNDTEKLTICWKIFNWIISNIKCKELIHKKDDDSEISIDSIFVNRHTNANGIAKLFKYLMDLLNINTIIIPGYLKTKNFTEKQIFFHENHYWNAIEINNQLRLIDCSCAGEIGSTKLKFPEFYFCAVPQHLIYTHFPQNLDYTCLKNVKVLMDLKAFEKLNIFNKFYFIYGFQLFSFKNSEIDFQELVTSILHENSHLNEFTIDFCLPERIISKFLLTSENFIDTFDLNRLVRIKKRKFNREEDRKKINTIDYYFYYESFLTKTAQYENVFKMLEDFVVYELNIRLHQIGNYKLSLLAAIQENFEHNEIKSEEIGKHFENCFNFKIFADYANVKEYNYKELIFPITTESFLKNDCEIIEPLFYHLGYYFVNKKNINFIVKIPEAIDAAIFYDSEDEFVIMKKKDDHVFSYLHNIEKKFEKINIAANFGENEYVILITYEF